MKSQSCHHPFRLHTIPGFLTAFVACAIGFFDVTGAAPTLKINPTSSGRIDVTLTADPGTYQLQSSLDLIHWSVIPGTVGPGLTYVLPQNSPATFYRAVPQTVTPGPFQITSTNLVATVAPGDLTFGNGEVVGFGGGIVQLQPGRTNFILLNLFDYTLHAFTRAIDRGSVFLGYCVTSSNSVVDIIQPPVISVPSSRVQPYKDKYLNGTEARVLLVGDSLTRGIAAPTDWGRLVFDSRTQAKGFNIPNASVTTVTNLGMISAGPSMGVAQLGRAVAREYFGSENVQFGLAWDEYWGLNQEFGASVNLSPGITSNPDFATVQYYNGEDLDDSAHTYKLGLFETVVRRLREFGVSVLILTSDPDHLVGVNDIAGDGPVLARIAEATGSEIADTWSYFRESFENGNNPTPYRDHVHQSPFGNQLYARAILGVLNTHNQTAEQTVPTTWQHIVTLPGYEDRFPETAECEFQPLNYTGTYTNTAITDVSNPAIYFGGLNPTNAMLVVTNGQFVEYTHNAFSMVDLLIQTDSGFSGTVSTRGGKTFVTNTTFTGTPTPTIVTWRLLNIEGVANYNYGYLGKEGGPDGKPYRFDHFPIRLTVTNGAAQILGAVFYTWERKPLRVTDMQLEGTWQNVPTSSFTQQIYTDSKVGGVSTTFYGRGVQFVLPVAPTAGIVSVTVDGLQTINGQTPYSYLDLFFSTNITVNYYLNLFPQPALSGPNWHTVNMTLVGSNTNALAPTSSSGTLEIISASVF